MSSTTDTSIGAGEIIPGKVIRTTYHETLKRRVMRWVLGCAWSMKPPRTLGVPSTLWMLFRHHTGLARPEQGVPDPETALKWPNGLVGVCSDLQIDTLLSGYRAGLYPFSHVGPQKWWAPASRMVLNICNFHIEKNLKRLLRKRQFKVTFDHAFEDVMVACAEPRAGRFQLTWITPDMVEAFVALHHAGHAHSVEVWDEEGILVGGAYGLATGQVFFTESQFSRRSNASKIGFATLNCHLQKWGFVLNDGKHATSHLAQAGFELMPRRQFAALLKRHTRGTVVAGHWSVDDRLDVGNWEPAKGPEQFES